MLSQSLETFRDLARKFSKHIYLTAGDSDLVAFVETSLGQTSPHRAWPRTHNFRYCKRGALNARFSPKATELLRRCETSLCAEANLCSAAKWILFDHLTVRDYIFSNAA